MEFTWPEVPPAHGAVVLRAFTDDDLPLVEEFSTDPYLPLIGSVPTEYTAAEGLAYIARQQRRLPDGAGYSFAIAEATTGRAVGGAGLWLRQIETGRATAGYAIASGARGRGLAGDALRALTTFAWTLPPVQRIELYVEPWNGASIATAERAGYEREGLLRSHQEIGGTRRDMVLLAAVRPAG